MPPRTETGKVPGVGPAGAGGGRGAAAIVGPLLLLPAAEVHARLGGLEEVGAGGEV